jgi:hypothetical protein
MVGFESATALGGEARNPLRTIPRAVIWSLILTGLFFVLMGYVEVFGTRGQHDTLDTLATPLNTLADLYNVSSFKLPLSLGAMVSFSRFPCPASIRVPESSTRWPGIRCFPLSLAPCTVRTRLRPPLSAPTSS